MIAGRAGRMFLAKTIAESLERDEREAGVPVGSWRVLPVPMWERRVEEGRAARALREAN